MIRTLAFQRRNPANPNQQFNPDVLTLHPLEISRWLDEAYARAQGIVVPVGADLVAVTGQGILPFEVAQQLATPAGILGNLGSGVTDALGNPLPAALWDHLIYAYLIESTGVFEILAEVVRRYAVGETLIAPEMRPGAGGGPSTMDGMRWLRTTEDLFFRDPAPYSAASVSSQFRPDQRIGRRNAYWRMFGLDLSHPVPPRWAGPSVESWKADVGGGLNATFKATWTELLRQLWLGFENNRNAVGANATDPNYIRILIRTLRDMMTMRRRGGQLDREEFWYVTTMSWFHLSVELGDSPIVRTLGATGASPDEQLRAIGQRVGMTPAARARELFDLAPRVSALLRNIELGVYEAAGAIDNLYLIAGPVREDTVQIIDLWQSATGERVKDRPTVAYQSGVGTPPAAAQPLRIPSRPTMTPALSGNGTRP